MSTLFKSVSGAFVAIFATISAFAANVAKIGDVNYSSISDAINAANAGETIELLSNVSVSGYFVYNKSFTIDGNGYTISCTSPNSNYPNYFVNVANGYSQTFKNMTIDANEKVPYAIQCIGSSSTLNLDNVIVKGGKTMKTKGKNDSYSQTRLGYGIHVNGGKVIANNLKVQNCTVTAAYLTGTSSNGTSPSFALSGDSCEIDVIGASEMDSLTPSITSSAKGCSVYDVEVKYSYFVIMTKTMKARIISSMGWNSLIDQVVEMASISPKSATVKLLQDVVLAETFVSNDTKLSIDGNGKTVTGTIKFTSSPSAVNNVVLGDGSTLDFTESENSGFSNVSVAANTGITILLPASANIESYTVPVAMGTDAVATIMVGDNKYIAKNGVTAPAETVAQIGDTRYSTLQAAIDAAANGATIHVLKDVALKASLTVASGKAVTLNLAGKSVTVSGADYALVNNGTLTIVDLALLTVVSETATVSDDAVPMVIGGVSANAGIAVIGDAVGGSIAGVQNKGVLSLESGLVVAASATVPAIDNAAGAVATIKGGAVEGNLQSVDAKDITVAGGTFTNSNVSEFLDGNQGVDSNGAIVAYVAQLGDAKYQTLEEAFGAAKEFDTVAVLDAEADVSDVAAYVAEGLYPISNGDGTYTLRAMPNATVKKLPAFTLSANAYSVWDGSVTEGTTDRPLDIVMNFLANDDGKQEANESGFADWTCDFYLTFSGMAGASLEADGCYLAGNYGGYGWYVIPAEDAIIDNGATIPVVSEYDAHITYRQICETVKKFTAAIHVDEAVMSANPDLKINLSLKMTNDRDPEQEIVVGSYDYTVADLKGELNPAVTVAEGVTVDDTFKANVANALANAYQAAEGNIDVTIVEKGATFATIDVSAKDGYEIPAEGLEMTFPVTSVADGETAIIIHKHEGKLYVSSAEAEYGFVTYNNTLGFSEFTVGDAAALNAALVEGGEIVLNSDVTGSFDEIENVVLTTTVPGGVTLKNTCTDWVGTTGLTLGRGVTLEMDNVLFDDAGENVIEGVLKIDTTLYNAYDSKTTVQNGGRIIAGGMIVNRYHYNADSGIFIYGDGDDSTVEVSSADTIGSYSGTFYVKDAVVEGNMLWIDYKKGSTEENDKYVQSNVEIESSVLNVTSELRLYKDASLTLTDTSVTAGKVQIRENAIPTVSIDNDSTIKATSVENLSGASMNAVLGEDGFVVFKKFVALVGNVGYDTLEDAISAANAGDTVVLLSDVVLTDTLTIDKSITLDGNGYTLVPADVSKTYNSAIMAGNSGWGDDHGETIKLVDIEISGWTVNYGVVRVQGVAFEMDGCDISGNTVLNASYGAVTLTHADSNVKNTVFTGNTCPKVIDVNSNVNSNGDGSQAEVVIEGCDFAENACSGAGVVLYSDGASIKVVDSDFVKNTVSTTGNGATVYFGFNDECTAIGCTFVENAVTTTHATTKRLAGGIFGDCGVTINNNIFDGNTATRGDSTAGASAIAIGAYYTQFGDIDISGNYYDGVAPEAGAAYVVEYGKAPVNVENYYTEYTTDESGNVTLTETSKVVLDYVASVNGVKYTTIQEAVTAATAGQTVTVIADVSDEAVTVDKNLTITGTVALNNVSINANGADELTVSGLTFTGNSWINSGTAGKLTVSGVTANVTPVNTSYTNSRGGFVSLGRSEQQALELTVENCSIVTSGDRTNPIIGWACITKAVLTGNTFGSAEAYQTNSDSVKFMSIADGAEFTITGNTLYSNYNGIVFGQNTTRDNAYSVYIDGNTFMGSADHIWIEVSGASTCHAIINATSDNTVNGNAFTASDIKAHPSITTWTSYAGVDVATDENGKVIGGTLAHYAAGALADGYEVVGGVVSKVKVAQVGDEKFASVLDAIDYAVENGSTEIKLLADSRELMPTDIEIILKANLTISADAPVTAAFYNNGTSYDFIIDCEGYGDYGFTIGENVTFVLEDRIVWVGYYGSNIDVVVDGTLSGSQIWAGGDIYVNETGTLKSTGEAFVIRRGKTVFVDGGKIEANYFNILSGNIFAENGAEIECGALWIDNTGSYANEGNVSISLWNSTLTAKGNLKSSSSSSVYIDVYDSTVSIEDVHGYGVSELDANTTLFVNGENGALTINKGINNSGTIEVYDGGELTVPSNASVSNNGSIILEVGSTIAGPADMGVEVEATDKEVEYVDGKYVVVDKKVAQIGETVYATIDDALASAKSGDTITLLADATIQNEYIVENMSLTIAGAATLTLDDKLSVGGEVMISINCPMSGQLKLLDGAIIKNSTVSGHGIVLGRVTFRGDNTLGLIEDYGDAYSDVSSHWTVEPGASLTMTEKARWGCGYGDKATVLGSLTDARTARESLTEDDISLFTHGAVMMSNWDVENAITVKDAYVVIGSNNSFGNSPKSSHKGSFDIFFENSVLDASRITFYSAPSVTEFTLKDTDAKVGAFMTRDADSVFVLTNSVLLSTATSNGNDEGNYHAGTLELADSSLTYSAPWVLENGTVEMDVASVITAPSITGTGTININSAGYVGEPVLVIAADMSAFTGTINLEGTASYEITGEGVLVKGPVAKIGDAYYLTLQAAIDAAQDGETVTLVDNVTFTEDTRTLNSGSWYDGLYYIGDKSFTINLGGFTITHDGSVNDYLLNFKNDGSKENLITLKNGTIDAGTVAYCAICTSGASTQKITINTENINIINNNSYGSTVKIRGGAELNAKSGTKITGKDSYLGIECVASTVNIYDGAEIYMNGTTSYNGCLVGACYDGAVNAYGGYGKGVKGGFIAMTSGGTINVYDGEWIANTDGSVADNSNFYVLTAQNNNNESGYVGASIINVTGGTFRGGMDAWVLNDANVEKAELNISGGNFNVDPKTYVVDGYQVKNNGDGTYSVLIEDVVAVVGWDSYKTFAAAVEAATNEVIQLVASATLAETLTVDRPLVIDLNDQTLTRGEGAKLTLTGANMMIAGGSLAGFGAEDFALSGNATLTLPALSGGYGFGSPYYCVLNDDDTWSVSTAFRAYIQMVGGEPRIGFLCDKNGSYVLMGATNLATPEWTSVSLTSDDVATDAAAIDETLPLKWFKPAEGSGYRFFKLEMNP